MPARTSPRRRAQLAATTAVCLSAALALTTVAPATAAGGKTATITADTTPGALGLLAWANGRGEHWLAQQSARGPALVDDAGTAVPVQRLADAKPGQDDVLLPPQGSTLVGWVRLADETFTPVRVDPATGLQTKLAAPDPADVPNRMRAVGTDGTRLVFDTRSNPRPAGGVGLRVLTLGGTALTTIAVPDLAPQIGGVDVSPDGRVLVALSDKLAVVDLATATVTPLTFARVDTAVWDAALDGDRITYATGGPAAGQTRTVRTCLISARTCTGLVSTPLYPRVVADARGYVWSTAASSTDLLAAKVSWGVWTGAGPQPVGTSTALSPALARTADALLVSDRMAGAVLTLDPTDGSVTTAYSVPDARGTVTTGSLDAGSVVVRQLDRQGRAVSVRRTITGTRATGFVLGAPRAGSADGLAPEIEPSSGRWSLVARSATEVAVVDGQQVLGKVTLDPGSLPRRMSGSWWSQSRTVWHGVERVRAVPGVIGAQSGPLVATRRSGEADAVYVADVRSAAAPTRVQVAGSAQILDLDPKYVLVALRTTAGTVRTTLTVHEWRTGATVWTRVVDGEASARLDGALVVWHEATAGSILAARIAEPATMATVVPTGVAALLDAHSNRVAWRPARTDQVKVSGVQEAVAAPTPGVVVDLSAAGSVAARKAWVFSADVTADLATGATAGWRLTVVDGGGAEVTRLTGRSATGAIRTSWTPPTAGTYTWTLTGTTTSGGSLVGPLGEASVTGTVSVTG